MASFVPKKVFIEASLVEEADNLPDEQIEKQVLAYLEKLPPKIPWVLKISKVAVASV